LSSTTRSSRPSESQLAFDFDATKLAQALAFLATSVRDLSKLKAAKLLYFADKQHLLQHGRPIIGDRYFCLDYGPVPTASLNIINDLISPVRLRIAGKELKSPMRHAVEQFVVVSRESGQPRLEARKSIDELDALTASERDVLSEVVKKYGKLTAGKLVTLTHREHSWRRSNADRAQGSSVEIPWEYFFEEAGETAEAVRQHAVEHQENRTFLSALSALKAEARR
jgi:uncharacterized phage-associated protein